MADSLQNSFTLEGVLFQGPFTEQSILEAKNFQSLPDDVFLCTYPRSGTTWVQNIIIGLYFGVDKVKASGAMDVVAAFPYLELQFPGGKFGHQIAEKIPEGQQRLLKSHLPPHLAPNDIFAKKRKTIVVVRNPKDLALSFHEFYQSNPRLVKYYDCDGLESFLDRFVKGDVLCGSWWDWTKAWVSKCRENPDSMLLIHYEDLQSSYEEIVDKITDFLSLTKRTPDQLSELKEATNVEEMRTRYKPSVFSFIINKGTAERWKTEFPEGFVEKFDSLTQEVFDGDEVQQKFL